MTKSFSFSAQLWKYQGSAAWHFFTLPEDLAVEINDLFEHAKRGWGSLPVQVTIGQTTWKTSIFTDKKSNSFLLPLKADIRQQEQLSAGDTCQIKLEISD